MSRPRRRRYLTMIPMPEPLPRCVAPWTDSEGLDRYRTTLRELGWSWETPTAAEEQAA